MIIGKLISAAASNLLPGPTQFLVDPVGTTLGGLVKIFSGHSAAMQAYLADPTNPAYLSQSAMVRGARKMRDRDTAEEPNVLLPGRYVPGGLLRSGGQNILGGAQSSLASVLSPGRGYVAP